VLRALAYRLGLFRRWQRDGSWARILAALQARADAAGLITWDVSVDSTVARAHQHGAGARKGDLQDEPPGQTGPGSTVCAGHKHSWNAAPLVFASTTYRDCHQA
jgi:hypothetical protein